VYIHGTSSSTLAFGQWSEVDWSSVYAPLFHFNRLQGLKGSSSTWPTRTRQKWKTYCRCFAGYLTAGRGLHAVVRHFGLVSCLSGVLYHISSATLSYVYICRSGLSIMCAVETMPTLDTRFPYVQGWWRGVIALGSQANGRDEKRLGRCLLRWKELTATPCCLCIYWTRYDIPIYIPGCCYRQIGSSWRWQCNITNEW